VGFLGFGRMGMGTGEDKNKGDYFIDTRAHFCLRFVSFNFCYLKNTNYPPHGVKNMALLFSISKVTDKKKLR